jgi:hypothetical protein
MPHPEALEATMSETAYRLHLMLQALRRSDAELFGNRAGYEAARDRLAAQLIAGKAVS